ncbi:MAG: hypothetical protein IT427_07515 [Pirellulales bacterium]|nr:hypothetical protein [Pirellulales bacterium]
MRRAADQSMRAARKDCMDSIHDRGRLLKAAEALAAIDRNGLMGELADAIAAARRQHRRETFNQTIGTSLYADGLASTLARTTGLPWRDCRVAIVDAVSPSWPSVAIEAIIAFAGEEVTR